MDFMDLHEMCASMRIHKRGRSSLIFTMADIWVCLKTWYLSVPHSIHWLIIMFPLQMAILHIPHFQTHPFVLWVIGGCQDNQLALVFVLFSGPHPESSVARGRFSGDVWIHEGYESNRNTMNFSRAEDICRTGCHQGQGCEIKPSWGECSLRRRNDCNIFRRSPQETMIQIQTVSNH